MNKKSLIILSLFVFGMLAPMVRAATYEYPLAKGTGESEVKTYDEDLWEDYVGDGDPTDTWGGDSDVVGAKAKSTIKEWEEADWDIYDIADVLASDWKDDFKESTTVEWDDVDAAGQSAEDIAELYDSFPDDEFAVWETTRDKWDFKDGAFDAEPDDEDDVFPVFQDPEDTEDLLDAANAFIATLTFVGTYLGAVGTYGHAVAVGAAKTAADGVADTYDGDSLCWLLFADLGLPMAKPVADYTDVVMEGLDPDDWEWDSASKVLTGELEGEDDYIAEISLSDMGVASKIVLKTEDDEIIYSIEGAAIPGYEVPIILGVAAFTTIGLIYLVMKKRK